MFYDAMITDGTSVFQASLMYYAVRRFGPRWDISEIKTCPDNIACAKPGDLEIVKSEPVIDEARAKAELSDIKIKLQEGKRSLKELDDLASSQPSLHYKVSTQRVSDNWTELLYRSKSPSYPESKTKLPIDLP